MLIVPLSGDKVSTGGEERTVLSYSPFRGAPSVLVEMPAGKPANVPFTEITAINGTPVTITPGKVFNASSKVNRRMHLPQPDDTIMVDDQRLKVSTVKIHERGSLTTGLLLVCEDTETKERLTVRLSDIERLERANGSQENLKNIMRTVYQEYLGSSGSAK